MKKNSSMKNTAQKPRRFYKSPSLKKFGFISGITRGDTNTNY